MYQNNVGGSPDGAFQSNARSDRSKLSLDFTNAHTPKKNDSQNNNPCFLDSPDMQMLKVDSPELEKMILDNYTITGGGSSTPTPTQFVNPKAVSQLDSTSYATSVPNNLYVDISSTRSSMNDLQQSMSSSIPNQRNIVINHGVPQYISSAPILINPNQHPTSSAQNFLLASLQSVPKVTESGARMIFSAPNVSSDLSHQRNLLSQISAQAQKSCNISTSSTYLSNVDQYSNSNSPNSVKTEPGNLSSSESVTSASEQSPLPHSNNPSLQDKIKQERKRLRNRIAATKCRKRKLEKISTLEDQVNELKKSNSDLSERKHQLREQIAHLKEKMMVHLKHGCQVHVQNMEAFGSS